MTGTDGVTTAGAVSTFVEGTANDASGTADATGTGVADTNFGEEGTSNGDLALPGGVAAFTVTRPGRVAGSAVTLSGGVAGINFTLPSCVADITFTLSTDSALRTLEAASGRRDSMALGATATFFSGTE